MKLSQRLSSTLESVTMKFNEKINSLSEQGFYIHNLTAGQLLQKPPVKFLEALNNQMHFAKSFQYPPVAGFKELREKVLLNFYKKRKIDLEGNSQSLSVMVSNGGKHSLYNSLGAIVDPGDQVMLLAPYWVSYPAMIELWGGQPCIVTSQVFDSFIPSIESIEKKLTEAVPKVIIINSPNNPAGIHYPSSWMKDFAKLMSKYPDVWLISDEIYSEVSYFDPKPEYFYQYDRELLKRTIIINGISKSLAATGLRIGFCIATPELIQAMSRFQGQTTSGANSLVQRALIDFDFNEISDFLNPICDELRKNSTFLRDCIRQYELGHIWYQTNSAYYFMLDLSKTNCFKRLIAENSEMTTEDFCQYILEQTTVALLPGDHFGIPFTARMSLVLPEIPMKDALNKLFSFLSD